MSLWERAQLGAAAALEAPGAEGRQRAGPIRSRAC